MTTAMMVTMTAIQFAERLFLCELGKSGDSGGGGGEEKKSASSDSSPAKRDLATF